MPAIMGTSFLVTLNHSEDVWDSVLNAHNVTLASSFAWTILSLSPEQCRRVRDRGLGYVHLHQLSWLTWKHWLTVLYKWMWAGRVNFSLTIFFTLLWKNLVLKLKLNFLIDWLFFQNAVLSSECLLCCLAHTDNCKRDCHYCYTLMRPDLLLNGLGRHKTWEKGNCQPGLHRSDRNSYLELDSWFFFFF